MYETMACERAAIDGDQIVAYYIILSKTKNYFFAIAMLTNALTHVCAFTYIPIS